MAFKETKLQQSLIIAVISNAYDGMLLPTKQEAIHAFSPPKCLETLAKKVILNCGFKIDL